MNENIVNFLNGYMMNPDPHYAVLLKGKWGWENSFYQSLDRCIQRKSYYRTGIRTHLCSLYMA